MNTFLSDISKQEFPDSERVSAKTIRHTILQLIQKDHPGFSHESLMSLDELNYYRERYIIDSLKKEIGELTELEQAVINSLTGHTTLSEVIVADDQQHASFGQKVADNVASFGGSWKFIILFGIFIMGWIVLNIVWLANKGFDPFPFILLNLILSCIAAMQAPVIMMSQNRQEEKDRQRARKDYMINLKSEIEIRTLHEKVDHMIMDLLQEIHDNQKNQFKSIQKIQVELKIGKGKEANKATL
jgi:uncharacterized membrane protein